MSSSAPSQSGNIVQLRKRRKLTKAPPSEAARYICQMTLELEKLANTSGLDLVGYFLALARAEAEASAQRASSAGAPATPQAPYLAD